MPLPGAVLPRSGIRSFEYQRSPTHVHNGIDIGGRFDSPVVAAAPGIVRFAERSWRQGFSGYGRVVVLEHPARGAWTLYAHLNQVSVQPGEQVTAGQPIGTVGRTQFDATDHSSLLPQGHEHLHFEVSAQPYPQASTNRRMDPVAWLQGAQEPELAAAEVPKADGPKAPRRFS